MEEVKKVLRNINLGLKIYKDEQTGFEKWKSDFNTFLSDDFQKQLNSSDKSVQENAEEEICIWEYSSVSTCLFAGKWGTQYSKAREEALNLLKKARESAQTANRLEMAIINIIYAANAAFVEPDF